MTSEKKFDLDKHLVYRQQTVWGTRGINNNQPLKYKPICELHSNHITAILLTQLQASDEIRLILKNELTYREEHRGGLDSKTE